MKFLLIALFSTLSSTAVGQRMKLKKSVFAPMEEAPEVVVYYLNKQAAATDCTPRELFYIDSKMLPDFDMTLLENNFEKPDWQFTAGASPRKLKGRSSSAPNCDFCRRLYPRELCNAMYNCRFRRQLRIDESAERELRNYDDLAQDLIDDCQNMISSLSDNGQLSPTCQKAIKKAKCYADFL